MLGKSLVWGVSSSLWAVAFLSASVTGAPLAEPGLVSDDIARLALNNIYKVLDGTLSDGNNRTSCNKHNVAVRKEFGALTKKERLNYIQAVKCLIKAPSRVDPVLYPGARTRYDDFVVVHMNMTPSVHNTANFLHWHRYYIWAYETALRTECGYKGYQPYWNWGKHDDLPSSPIWNGDKYSMGGNGDYIPHQDMKLGSTIIPAGLGGGCVTTGPFANMTVNLGPREIVIDPALNVSANPRPDGFGYNPRCLRRDLSNHFTHSYMRDTDIVTHITRPSHTRILAFQDSFQAITAEGFTLHGAGHFSISGDPGGDVWVSPGDPTFWLHHAQVDRHWWMWQNYIDTELKARTWDYEGGTKWRTTESPAGHIEDLQWLDVVAPKGMDGVPSTQLVSSVAGIFCFVYE